MSAWVPRVPVGRAPSCERIAFPGSMRALSVRQPWAYVLAAGYKPVENRTWKPVTGPSPLWLAIHAGMRVDPARPLLEDQIGRQIPVVTRAVIGAMLIDDYVTESDSPWFVGPIGWCVARSVLFAEPIGGVQGALNRFHMPPAVAKQIESCWSDPRTEFFSWRS